MTTAAKAALTDDATTAAAALLLASAAAAAVMAQQQQPSTQTEPRRISSLPHRTSNLSRFRSVTDRGMNSKYHVDWKVVLGEGAYGSVHPARLAATGEKVRVCVRNASNKERHRF